MSAPGRLVRRGRVVRSAGVELAELRDEIQRRWLERVEHEIPAARGQSRPALLDDMPGLLDAIAKAVAGDVSTSEETIAEVVRGHTDTRLRWSSYTLDHIVREYAILRQVILATIEEHGPLTTHERDIILDSIEEGIRVAVARFSSMRALREGLEFRYLKLVEQLVTESSLGSGVPERLERLLDVLRHGLGAEAALIAFERESNVEVRLAATSAETTELAEIYRGALALSDLSRPASESTPVVRMVDVDRLEPNARDALTLLDIKWIVALKLFSRDAGAGMLCIGFRERRTFDPLEIHLLEVLGDRVSVLLTMLRVQDESRTALERIRRENLMIEGEKKKLEDERERRDEFIAAVSHDLKSPLTAAKLRAEQIRKAPPDKHALTETLATQIVASIDRSDRMIHDLLDAHRIRAGKRLPLTIEEYSMTDLVAEVVREQSLAHGDRFVVRADGAVKGYWCREGMRRALDNLLSNAVKYGDPNAPITISIASVDDTMRCSVHNEGTALGPEEQKRILQPFERGTTAERSGKKGWGIGLTLVQGIVHAHGGKLEVESAPGRGTTFTILNPMDSRPYQDGSIP